MAEIRIGNGKWAIGNETLMGYGTTNNKYKPILVDGKRFSGKTTKNKNKELTQITNNTPCVNYNVSNHGALDIQNQVTIYSKNSENFDNSLSEYFLSGADVNLVQGTNSPKNDIRLKSDANEELMQISKLTKTGFGGGAGYLQYSETATSGQTFSIFAKAGSTNFCGIAFGINGIAIQDVLTVDLTNGNYNFDNTNNIVDKIHVVEYFGDWYRINILSQSTSGTYLYRVFAPNAINTKVSDNGNSIFITGLNFTRDKCLLPYVNTYGFTLTIPRDIMHRIGNCQLFLPLNTANPQRGLTWTMKFYPTELIPSRYICLGQTGMDVASSVDKSVIVWNMLSLGSGNFDLRFEYNLGSAGYVYGSSFVVANISDTTLKIGQTYHVGVTFENGRLRLSLNGSDANILNNGSTPNSGSMTSYFAPVLNDSSTNREFNDLRFTKANVENQPMPAGIIDTAIYDRAMTQSELNSLTLQ
jgi:hypothetical protein